jgi:threonine/homoserine/homoserine lactone efflux protein
VGEAIGVVLPYAVGVAISPVPIIAVILVLFSARARVNGPVFLVGWVVGVTIVSVAVYFLSDASDASTDDTASDTVSTGKLVLGVLLLVLAVRHFRAQRGAEARPEPKWMASIDSLTPVKAGGLGVLLSGVNPKNLALSLAAGASLAQVGATGGEAVAGLLAFVIIASLSIGIPVVFYLFGGDRAAGVLDRWKGWLSTHNDAVMGVLFLVFGVVILGQGLQTLDA